MSSVSFGFTKRILAIVMWAMSIPLIHAQSCFPNGLTISTQQQIDDFTSLYPNCTEIGGNLFIVSSALDPVHSLNGLSQLTSIDGDLRIAENDQLQSLSGLENLEYLTGGLLIFDNSSLDDISALSNLTSIRGALSIGKNDNLTSLFGLQNIGLGMTDLRLFDNDLLSDCSTRNFCSYLSNGGNHTISSNAFGCNETGEILSICLRERPCAVDRLRVNFTPILDGLYQAIEEVTSFGEVPNFGDVDFVAGTSIVLESGFEVRPGATFTAFIADCGQ